MGQDLLTLQANAASATALDPALRARLDGLVQQSLTRLKTLAELRALDLAPEAGDGARYIASRVDEASYLAQLLHRELLAVLGK